MRLVVKSSENHMKASKQILLSIKCSLAKYKPAPTSQCRGMFIVIEMRVEA
jgi:hypothetical protein